MHPMQFASFAVYIGNQPSLLGALRQPNTSTGQTARQKPQALHICSEMTTSHLPAGPRGAIFSVLNSAIPLSPRHDLQHDLFRIADMGTRQALRRFPVVSGDGFEDAPVLAVGVLETALGL